MKITTAEMDIGRAKNVHLRQKYTSPEINACIFPLVSANAMERRWSASAMVSQGFLKCYSEFLFIIN